MTHTTSRSVSRIGGGATKLEKQVKNKVRHKRETVSDLALTLHAQNCIHVQCSTHTPRPPGASKRTQIIMFICIVLISPTTFLLWAAFSPALEYLEAWCWNFKTRPRRGPWKFVIVVVAFFIPRWGHG